MITLHHLNNSRSQRIIWLLEELKLEYVIEFHKRDAKTYLAGDSLKGIHALGKSPVISDDKTGMTLAESGAIIEYLVQTYGAHLMPEQGSAAYWQYLYWLHFSEGSLMPPMVMNLVLSKVKDSPMPFFVKPIAKKIADQIVKQFSGPNIKRSLEFIEEHLSKNTWFCGDQLTGADVQMSFPLEASAARGMVDQYPNILAYVKRFQALPAYQAALAKGGDYDYA
ncbi:Glutathione S-transferase-like protein [Oleispira antarctica RB-8]|uniref:glutathione transferase n=1 Tax=Oleispira antarctica RB-8 TaxID=698738 RepID=R4YMZ4_OLEAN|nr:Glutathione S-transferase-like protein [Oleispira antarctica RB-8]